MAPELTLKRLCDPFKAEVWAIGVLFYKLLTGKFPFKGENDKALYKEI
jgi:serine/threonine protein kinase